MKIVDKIQIKNQGQIVKFLVNAQNFWSMRKIFGQIIKLRVKKHQVSNSFIDFEIFGSNRKIRVEMQTLGFNRQILKF